MLPTTPPQLLVVLPRERRARRQRLLLLHKTLPPRMLVPRQLAVTTLRPPVVTRSPSSLKGKFTSTLRQVLKQYPWSNVRYIASLAVLSEVVRPMLKVVPVVPTTFSAASSPA